MIKPIFTEKSTKLAKEGMYTFVIDQKDTKADVKAMIKKLFDVEVKSVNTVKIGGERKRNYKGFKVVKNAIKKAIVTLKDGKKLDIFEEKKK